MIPTAEDVLIKKSILLKTIEESGNFPLNLTRDTHIGTAKQIKLAMIEFAKLHVTEALKQASEKAKVDVIPMLKVYNINREEILEAYSLDNIV